MEAIFNVLSALGLVGSVTLLLWGMSLSLRHGLGDDEAPRRTERETPGTGFAGRIPARS